MKFLANHAPLIGALALIAVIGGLFSLLFI